MIPTFDDDLEHRGVCEAVCAELYAVIDRNRAHLHKWLEWAHAGFDPAELNAFIRKKACANSDRLSLTMNIRYRGELCRAIVGHAFAEYDLHRIEIRCAPGNRKSAGVALRVGFREEAILREAERVHHRWHDLRVFGKVQPEWVVGGPKAAGGIRMVPVPRIQHKRRSHFLSVI